MAGELSTNRRARLHPRIAEALKEFYGSEVESHATELAHHFFETQSVLGTDKLVHYSLLAGEGALVAYAWEDAQTHFRRGLTAKGIALTGFEPPADGETAALLFGQGRARLSTVDRYEFHEAVASLRRAFDYFVDAG
jgi:hypothetical protein